MTAKFPRWRSSMGGSYDYPCSTIWIWILFCCP